MEVRKRRTLTGFFIKYICIFCGDVILLILLMVLTFVGLTNTGALLPANYMETWINDNRDRIVNAEVVTEAMLPLESMYGVYDMSEGFLYGNFEKQERTKAWEAYLDNDIYARDGGLYRFLIRKDEEVCIVKYFLKMQASNRFFRKYFPAPEFCIVTVFLILFLLQTVFLSRYFAKILSKRLKVLNDVTEKIRCQDLEIGENHSDIWEIDEVLESLSRMGGALKEALEEQWRLEKHKREQVAALAHDIKTPLTVIKGNAELLSEEEIGSAAGEYNRYIRENAAEIEGYLIQLQKMLLSEEKQAEMTAIPAGELAERLVKRAELLAAGYPGGKKQVAVQMKNPLSGEVICDIGQIQRAWDNIVSNALEYSLPDGSLPVPEGRAAYSLLVTMEIAEEGGKDYLAARVTDRGRGFTKEELAHAAEQFYQGDKSRHEKRHRGLGLYTAARFAARQGGRLILENAGEEGYGGKVSLLLLLDD